MHFEEQRRLIYQTGSTESFDGQQAQWKSSFHGAMHYICFSPEEILTKGCIFQLWNVPIHIHVSHSLLRPTSNLSILLPVHSPITQCDLSSPLVGDYHHHLMLAILEVKWSGITLDDWWRNEQEVIGGTSAHPAAVLQGLLKVIAGFDISFTLTYKSATPEDGDDEFADLYVVKWSFLMVPPTTIMILNLIVIAVGVARTMYSPFPQWSRLLGGVFFSFWVLSHLYPFAKGLMGRRGRVPTMFTFLGEHEVSVPLMKFSTSSMFSFLPILIHLLCTVRSFCACR